MMPVHNVHGTLVVFINFLVISSDLFKSQGILHKLAKITRPTDVGKELTNKDNVKMCATDSANL